MWRARPGFFGVAVSASAQAGLTNLTIVSGLQMTTQASAFQIGPAFRSFWISSDILNASTAAPGVAAGSQAVLTSAVRRFRFRQRVHAVHERSLAPDNSLCEQSDNLSNTRRDCGGGDILRLEAAGEAACRS